LFVCDATARPLRPLRPLRSRHRDLRDLQNVSAAIDTALMRFRYDRHAKSIAERKTLHAVKWFPSNLTARAVHSEAYRAVVYHPPPCTYCEPGF
jgi:hypothetical protein